MSTALTSETFSEFVNWLAAGRRVMGLALTSGQLAFGDSTGAAYVFIPGISQSFTRRVIAAVHISGQRPWSDRGDRAALRIAREGGVPLSELEWIRDATSALYTLKPDLLSASAKETRNDQRQNSLGLVCRGAARDAVATARLMVQLQQGADPAALKAALLSCKYEQMWRPRQLKGWRVNTGVLEREIQLAQEEADRLTAEYGIDLVTSATDADQDRIHGWLAQYGIEIRTRPDAQGNTRRTLSRKMFDRVDTSKLAEEGKQAWTKFKKARSAYSRMAKLQEIKRALIGDRIYSTLTIRGAKTGRATSVRVALQNLHADLRPLLIADEGEVLVSLDLANAEPRVAAALSGDQALLADIYSADGVYVGLARRMWPDDAFDENGIILPERRKAAKNTFLQVMYGAGPDTLADKLGIGHDEAGDHIAKMWAAYPHLAAYQNELRRRVRIGERMVYLSGRPMPTPAGMHAILNAKVQGEASDVFYEKMAAVLNKVGLNRAYLPIHDELVVSVPIEFAEVARQILEEEMNSEFLGVQMTGVAEILGRSWRK